MKITSKLALKYVNKNKKTSIACITGITIATIIITAIFIILASYQEYIMNLVRSEKNFEAEFLNIKYSDAKEIAKDENIKETSIIYEMGVADEVLDVVGESQTKEKISILAYNQNAIKNNHLEAIEGRLPENDSEIVLYKIYSLSKKLHIGQTIDLTINGKTKTYTLVGLIKQSSYYNKSYYASTAERLALKINRNLAITCLNEKEIKDDAIVDISIITKDISKIEETTKNLISKLNLYDNDENKIKESLYYNKGLLNYALVDINYERVRNDSGYEFSSERFEVNVKKAVGTLIAITFISSIIVINTAFKMNYQEKIKEIGMLTSVGMNNKQKRNMLLKEGLALGTIGIIIGLLLGTGIALFLIRTINIIIKNTALSEPIRININIIYN